MVCIGFFDDWFSIFPNKVFGKILFLKEKICNFLLSFCKISFVSVCHLFFFFSLHWVLFAECGLLTAVYGFSCCGAWTLEHMGSVVTAHWLLLLGHLGLAAPQSVEHT